MQDRRISFQTPPMFLRILTGFPVAKIKQYSIWHSTGEIVSTETAVEIQSENGTPRNCRAMRGDERRIGKQNVYNLSEIFQSVLRDEDESRCCDWTDRAVPKTAR